MGNFMSQNDIEAMFQALHGSKGPAVAPVKYQELKPLESQIKGHSSITSLANVDLTVDVELGSTRLTVREVLDLDKGMVVHLDCLAGDPVNVGLNGVPFARGEVVVISDYFGVRITELLPDELRAEKKKG